MASGAFQARKDSEKGERPLFSQVFRDWAGCYTRSARTAMPQDRWRYLINLQPVGPANVQTIPDISAVLHDFGADTIYQVDYANISGVDYMYLLANNGKIFQYRISDGTTTWINSGKLLSGAGSAMDQWKNLVVLFIDSTGYYSWDGTTFTKIVVAGAPSKGDAIAVYAGRVWIAQGRALIYSVVDGTNGVDTGYGNNANDWNVLNGSSLVYLTDPHIRSKVTRMKSGNGYLYLFSRTSINVIGDVYVPSGSVLPVFSNVNIQEIIGTDQPGSVFMYNRTVMLANRYGGFAINGSQAVKISDDIDGTWKTIDFGQVVSGGQAVINNILTACFLIKQQSDPNSTITGNPFPHGEYLIGMWWDSKWWFSNFGQITYVCQGYANNMPSLFAMLGNKLYLLFSNTATDPSTLYVGPLWDMGDPITDKQTIKVGMEMSVNRFNGSIDLNVDTTNSSTAIDQSGNFNAVTWVNNAGATVTFVNNSLNPVTFYASGYVLFWGKAPGSFSKYVGFSGSTTAAQFQLSGLMMDFAWGARW